MIMASTKPLTFTGEELPNECVTDLAQVFKLLGDETRLRMVLHIARHGEQNVTQLCELVGLPQPLVSHHLGLLRNAGVLETRRDGKHTFYHVRRRHFEQLMSALSVQLEDRPPCCRFMECMLG